MSRTYTQVARRFATRFLYGAAGAVLLAAVAQAQTAPPPPAAAAADQSADQGALATVTVTAEKRTENLQKVPVSATVRSGTQLKEEGVYGIQSLQSQTPGLSIQPAVSSETYINIRGVGIQYTSPVSSNGVAFYVDGMYVPSLIDTVDTFYDLNNVEVLRGPQGTLVGSNADGGAIFVNSVQPSFSGVKGYIQQTIGSYNDYRTEGGINLPINDWVAARLAFVHETRDSFTTNVGVQPTSPYFASSQYPGGQNQPGNVDFSAARLQVLFRPTDNFDLTVRFEPYESANDGYPLKPDEAAVVPIKNYFNSYGVTEPSYYDPWAATHQNDPFLIDYDVPQYFDIEGQRTSATGIWHITPDIEAKDVFSYQDGYEKDLSSIDSDSSPSGTILTRKASFSDYTEEFDLLSTSASPLQWVAGFYYLNTTGPLQLQFTGGPPLNLISYHQTYAGFASFTYTFSPQWSLTLGGRYSYDYQPFDIIVGPPPSIGLHHTSDSEPTGSAKLNFQVTPATLIYASVSNGYKAGGLQLFPVVPYAPETNVVGELGLKTDFMDHHLRFDGDVFDGQYSDYQIEETACPFGICVPFIQTPGAATTWGVEAELTGQFDDLQFDLGGSYLNATIDKNFTWLAAAGDNLLIPAGSTLPFSPNFTFTGGVQYAFHVWNGTLTPRLQYQYQALQYASLLHAEHGPGPFDYAEGLGLDIPAHGTWDFMLTYAAPEHWQIQGYVTNFTNSTYISNVTPSASNGAPPAWSYGPPIQYGVRLSYNF